MWRFVRNYFVKLGFLDGRTGFIIASNSAHAVYLKYVKLHKLNEQKREQ